MQNNHRNLVIGGAGFIGSHLVEKLVKKQQKVVVYDNLSSGLPDNLKDYQEKVEFIRGDLLDLELLKKIIKQEDVVWMLGANSDIQIGENNTSKDLYNNLIGLYNVLEAMRIIGSKNLIFSSSSTVYGNLESSTYKETSGPLQPISLFGASKVAGEAYISSYCNLFGIKALVFRLGNVIGGKMPRGIIKDFILKLKNNPNFLEVLGDGRQRKNFILVDDCIDGMVYMFEKNELENGECEIFNLGTRESISIDYIKQSVLRELQLKNTIVTYKGGKGGWNGDQTKIELDITKILNKGWEPKYSSKEAIDIAVNRMNKFLENKGVYQ